MHAMKIIKFGKKKMMLLTNKQQESNKKQKSATYAKKYVQT